MQHYFHLIYIIYILISLVQAYKIFSPILCIASVSHQVDGVLNAVLLLCRQLMVALRCRNNRLRTSAGAAARHRRPPTCGRRRLLAVTASDVRLAAGPRRPDGNERDVVGPIRAGSGRERKGSAVDRQIVNTALKGKLFNVHFIFYLNITFDVCCFSSFTCYYCLPKSFKK
jgi:hypothetical protein